MNAQDIECPPDPDKVPDYEPWPGVPKEFNDWWDGDSLTKNNPFQKNSPAYWSWEGWCAAQRKPLTDRERVLLDDLIRYWQDHAKQCDSIQNRKMAERQKGWDLERVALLRKLAGIK